MLRSSGDDASLVLSVASFDGVAFASSWKMQIGELRIKEENILQSGTAVALHYVCVLVCVFVSVPDHCTCLSVCNDAAIVSFQHRNHNMMRTNIIHLFLCGTVRVKEKRPSHFKMLQANCSI